MKRNNSYGARRIDPNDPHVRLQREERARLKREAEAKVEHEVRLSHVEALRLRPKIKKNK